MTANSVPSKIFTPKAARPAPVKTTGAVAWMRQNLFNGWFNTVLTLAIVVAVGSVLPAMLDWVFLSASFSGTAQADCTGTGACWVFINAWSQQLFYGTYPAEEIWRINICVVLMAGVLSAPVWLPHHLRNRVDIALLLLFPLVAVVIMDGRLLGLEYVSTDHWGGFTFNVMLAAVSMILGMPLGFLWALGRRSTSMPMIRSICVVLIEFFRGVPILALFFMGSVMLPLFFPEGTTVDKLLRVWIVLVLFMAGYMAEVYRGGFQAIPKGQYEAADSLGLSYWQTTLLVILPQVIKVSMPNILATAVMLFKNTTFLLIIGVPEVLNTAQSALNNSAWLGGYASEAYLFVGFVFWCCCFGMSMASNRIERKLDTTRR